MGSQTVNSRDCKTSCSSQTCQDMKEFITTITGQQAVCLAVLCAADGKVASGFKEHPERDKGDEILYLQMFRTLCVSLGKFKALEAMEK